MHSLGGHQDKSVTHNGDCEACPPNMCCSENAHRKHRHGGGGNNPSHDENCSYIPVVIMH